MKKCRLILIALLITACFGSASAPAQELGPTLQKIKDSGVILVGSRETAVPFSYLDSQGQPIGYGHDYADNIIQAIKDKLSNQDLQVKYVPITTQNRIPLLQKGIYDFECGSTTNNRDRQKQVAFSNTFFICGTRLLVEKDSGIKDFGDLWGKNVMVTAGTTSEKTLSELNEKEQLGLRIISTKDYNDALQTLATGRASAFLLDDVLLASEIARSSDPGKWEIVGTPQTFEAYGCMLRKNDSQFKQLLDETVAQMQLAGEAEKSYQRWFTQPVPPSGLNLNFELSEAMRELFKNPNDKPFQ